jgi:hypothetical protein
MLSLSNNEKCDKQSRAPWLMTFPNFRMSVNNGETSLQTMQNKAKTLTSDT